MHEVGFAIDLASYAGVVTPEMAKKIVSMGYTKAIVNLWCDGYRYDEFGNHDGSGKTIVEWQVDSFREAGAEVDGYIYYYFAEDAETRTLRLLANLNGRPINFLWLDWEDDDTQLSVEGTIAYIHKAQNACIGIVLTGHYTRREWWIRRTGDTQEFAGQWIWDATNDQTPDMSWNPYGGFKHYMEQFAFNVRLVPGMGTVDLNVFYKPDAPAPVPAEPPPPELPPATEEATPPPPETTPVMRALAAVDEALGLATALRIAIEQAKELVAAIPQGGLAEVFKRLQEAPNKSGGTVTTTPSPFFAPV